MTKILSLTPEQVAAMPTYVEKWLKIGLSTEPLDFDRAKEAACKAYSLAGLAPPKHFYRFQSPVSAAMGAVLLKDGPDPGSKDKVWTRISAEIWDHVWDQVCDQVSHKARGQVMDQVWDQVGRQVSEQVRAQVWAEARGKVMDQVWVQTSDQLSEQVSGEVWQQVRGQVMDQVARQVRTQVWQQVRDQVEARYFGLERGKVGSQIWGQFMPQVYGCMEAPGLAFYDFFKEACGLATAERCQGLMDLAHVCGWWTPYKDLAIFQDRPEYIKMEDGRLHCTTGPSIRYRDGFSVYSLRGTRVPAEWIAEGKMPTIDAIFRLENLELRRACCEYLGWDKILSTLNPRVIDAAPDPYDGTLLEVDLPGGSAERFLKVLCPTGRTFVLSVDRNSSTAKEARAKTFGREKLIKFQLEA